MPGVQNQIKPHSLSKNKIKSHALSKNKIKAHALNKHYINIICACPEQIYYSCPL